MTSSASNLHLRRAVERATDRGVRSIQLVSYRDLDDAQAGGSERHLHEVMTRWAAGGLDVRSRTVAGSCPSGRVERDGYTVERRGGYSLGVPGVTVDGLRRRFRQADALVDVWNGWPTWSPLWWPRDRPRLTVLHHLHGDLWHSMFPSVIAYPGAFIERRVAPRLYRSAPVATLSPSSAAELVADTPFRASDINIVAPGIAKAFTPPPLGLDERGGVVCVARLTPTKRVDAVVRAVAEVIRAGVDTHLTVIGEGPMDAALRALAAESGVADRIRFVGAITDAELVDSYRSARLVASASSNEGWGMTITEAAACATPAVASDITGHRDALAAGAGVLAADDAALAEGIRWLLTDDDAWHRASHAARGRADELSWDATAAQLLDLLIEAR